MDSLWLEEINGSGIGPGHEFYGEFALLSFSFAVILKVWREIRESAEKTKFRV